MKLCYSTPYNRVFALNSEAGEEKWMFNPQIDIEGKGLLHCRGVSSWIDPDKTKTDECHHRIITATIDADLYAIDIFMLLTAKPVNSAVISEKMVR